MTTWYLEDAGPIAEEAKYTFYKPSPEAIRKIVVGENVKLIFRFQSEDPEVPRAERMWVIVREIGPGDRFAGSLDNDPAYISDLKCGDPIEFRACHIINTEHDEHDNMVERYLQRCLFDDSISRDEMLEDQYLGDYLRGCIDDRRKIWRFPQKVRLIFFGEFAKSIGDYRRH